MSSHDRCGKIWNSPHLACVWCRKRRHICKIYAIFLKKISFVKNELCRKIRFVVIYALLCGEKFVQKFSMWRKNDKYEVCTGGQKGPKQNQNGPKSPKVVNMVPKSPKWSHKAQNGPSDSKTCLIHDYMSYWATLGTFSGPRGLYYKPKQHQNDLKWPKITLNGPALPKIITVNLTPNSGA